MRAVIQRVRSANVWVENEIVSEIGLGLLILLGIEESDLQEDAYWLVDKINGLRIFNDENDKMNLSIQDVGGKYLVISQFTLFASTKKGNRPSYLRAARPDTAIPLYEIFLNRLSQVHGKKVGRGIFGADMKVNLLNDGPVTIIIDTKQKE